MALSSVTQKRKIVPPSKKTARAISAGKTREIAAGEFKAKCLGLMREIANTGKPVLVTMRGKPLVEVGPPRSGKKSTKKDDFIGRWEGILTINGDPDDLIKPVFPLEDYDMLK
ncbi:MAG: hypothetical protein ACLPPV_14075 [Candidatus Korobacteraceae bacterium]|jgi:hypothetical protein